MYRSQSINSVAVKRIYRYIYMMVIRFLDKIQYRNATLAECSSTAKKMS